MLEERDQPTAAGALRLAWKFGAPHRRWFYRGLAATVLVVAGRLAMPWPLLGIIELAGGVQAGPHGVWLPEALAWVAAYITIAALLGYVEKAQRVRFKGYAARSVHEIRSEAVEVIRRTASKKQMPDLLSRIIGDTARIKAEMSGILVHVSQNGLYFLGVCIVFAFLAPRLSVIFLLAGCFAVAVGYVASHRITVVTTSQRKKEAAYAEHVHDVLRGRGSRAEGDALNEASARHDTSATKLIAIAAWIVHIGLAILTGVGLIIAIHEVEHGRLLIGEVFLFIAYVLTVHRRMIQVGRQLARGGKFIANMNRVGELLRQSPAVVVEPTTPAPDDDQHRRELCSSSDDYACVDLRFTSGSRTAVVSLDGSRPLSVLNWNSTDEQAPSVRLHGETGGEEVRAGFVPREPEVEGHPLSEYLPRPGVLHTREAKRLGLQALPELADDLIKNGVASGLNRYQAQALRLAELLWCEPHTQVWVVEDPVSGIAERKARRILKAISKCAGERTVVVSLPEMADAEDFDRLIVIEDNGVVFDGHPAQWAAGASVT
jgi:ABC-type multidrug transport system fused ATPase/permease subunit